MIKAVFFDLDHTLWDFDKNAEQTFIEMFNHFGYEHMLAKMPQFLARYKVINKFYWARYNKNKVGKEELRWQRAKSLYGSFGIKDEEVWKKFIDFYAKEAPQKNALCSGAEMLIASLKNKYKLLILTNGFEQAQIQKLKKTPLENSFDTLISSETAACKKPDKRFFAKALEIANCKPEEAIMLGDNFTNDYLGGLKVGLHSYLYDPENKKIQCKHRISHLSEFFL